MDSIVILGNTRTPIGNFQGELKEVSATQLGSVAIRGALEKSHIRPDIPQSVIMGCVLTAGLGQAPARQASIGAGIPSSVGCSTVNKVCGSGMKTVMFAHDGILAGSHDIIVAGGMESMTNSPYLLPKARAGYRLGNYEVIDEMFFDGLEDAYEKGTLMGVFAERCAEQFHFSRKEQDAYALSSLERARKAMLDGTFKREITPVIVKTKKEEIVISEDEGPRTVNAEKIAKLQPAFVKGGTITAANSSSISDGAAALVVARLSTAKKMQLQPVARIVGHSTHSQQPDLFTTAPIGAIKTLLDKIQWKISDVDLFEINEAFAVVVLAIMKELKLSRDKVNVHGGASVLGHPIGASGARLLVTLINALQKYRLKKGIASLCIGGGEATAMAIELF